jgi:hypothetical protein
VFARVDVHVHSINTRKSQLSFSTCWISYLSMEVLAQLEVGMVLSSAQEFQ